MGDTMGSTVAFGNASPEQDGDSPRAQDAAETLDRTQLYGRECWPHCADMDLDFGDEDTLPGCVVEGFAPGRFAP